MMTKYCCKTFIPIFFLFIALALHISSAVGNEKDLKDIRPSALAGAWYPGSKETLSQSILNMLSEAKTRPLEGKLKALIVPHAGHRYSGDVAAHAYRLLQRYRFKRIILVGPSHYLPFKGVSINLQAGYETPLGVVPVDLEMAEKILNASPLINWIKQAHAREHSLEIQLPFLQMILPDFRIVPILMGQQDLETCSNLADSLAKILKDAEDTLLVASSDLSHFHPYDRAKVLDQNFIRHVQRFDVQELSKNLSKGKCEACGGGPVITVMLAAKAMNANRSVILKYANSGDVTGDHSRVVGYMSAALSSSDTDRYPK